MTKTYLIYGIAIALNSIALGLWAGGHIDRWKNEHRPGHIPVFDEPITMPPNACQNMILRVPHGDYNLNVIVCAGAGVGSLNH